MILYINELPNEIIEDNSNNETTLYIKLKKKKIEEKFKIMESEVLITI